MAEQAIQMGETDAAESPKASTGKLGTDEIQFFGEFERHPRSGFRSEYPAWSEPRALDDLKNELRQKQEAVDTPGVPNKLALKESVRQLKERIALIEASRPKFAPKQKDHLYKMCGKESEIGELGQEIMRSYPKRSDQQRGITDSYREVERDTTPCVKVPSEFRAAVAAAGVPINGKGLVTRDGAVKAWKIARRSLGEMSHSELLRNQS